MSETGADDGAGPFEIGPFEWTPTDALATAFRAAAGDAEGFTLPAAALGLPAFRAALNARLPEGFLPVHESQELDCPAPLRAGRAYALTAAVERRSAPERMVVVWRLMGAEGLAAGGRTTLRLFSLASGSVGAPPAARASS